MSIEYLPVQVKVAPPPRGDGQQTEKEFFAKACRGSFAWGSAPGTATIVYVGDAPVSRGAHVALRFGAHLFAGICKSDTNLKSSRGQDRTLQFVDFREYLTWDYTFCAFNKADVTNVGGVRRKRYWHILPANYGGLIKTYSDEPLAAFQMVNYILTARVPGLADGFADGTVGSPWSIPDYTGFGQFPTGVLSAPIYDFDSLSNGKRLDAALNEICERTGTVFTLFSTEQEFYKLVFTRKGYGSFSFPTNSDDRRLGESLSGNATNVRILGERNRYQVMDLQMVPDWTRAWEIFLQVEEFAEDIFQRGTNPITDIRYNAYAGDVEFYRGRQDAMARAKEMTVREYVALRNDAAFADHRKFSGRSRMDMPAALYIQTLLLRAFRPAETFFLNKGGRAVPLSSAQMVSEQVCKVTYSPGNGTMTAHASASDGNGLALVKGYQVGEDLFRLVGSDQLDASIFSAAKAIWSAVPFQIDESGEGGQFIVFDAPVFVCDNLFRTVNGHAVLNANWSLSIPPVKAALCFEAERYSSWWGTWPNASRDSVESVPSLRSEFVLQNGVHTELPYADGKFANEKAQQLANWLLLQQWVYAEGGYKLVWDPLQPRENFGTQLSSLIDRVEFVSSGTAGTFEIVDLTTERQRDNFEPERELDRATLLATLFPGQAQLREEADAHRKAAAVFRQLSPQLLDLFNKLVTGQISNTGLKRTWFVQPPAAAMLAGTPIRKKPTSGGVDTVATYPAAVTSDDKVFCGITVRENEAAGKPFYVATGGVVPARVLGPIDENEAVGLTADASDWLEKNGTPSVGRALQRISASAVELIMVQLGAGGGSTSEFKLFRVTVADSGGDGINVAEIRIGNDGSIENLGSFGTIAKPLHLRPACKPFADAVIYPGYVPGFATSIQIGGGILPMAPDIIVGFKPPFGTGIETIEWQDFGLFRHWAIPITACRNGLPTIVYIHQN